ncbi:MAG: T9SS type A sorting domain-containing protein, partial [Cyclobacteriaceae bacterium]
CDGALAGRIARITDISVENIQNEIQVYPNPASDILIISSAESVKRLALFDAFGKDITVSFDGKSIDISHLKAGLYFLRLEVAGSTTEKRIIIR